MDGVFFIALHHLFTDESLWISWLNGYRWLNRDFEYWPQTSEALIQIAMIHLMPHRLAPRTEVT